MKKFNYINLINESPKIKSYLDPFNAKEEGGFLLGTRVPVSENEINVTLIEFYPVKSNYKAYDLSTEDLKEKVLPATEIGYYPDPKEYFKMLKKTKTFDSSTDIMEIGFVHNHYNWHAYPSRYDLTHVNRQEGYLMSIYSNLDKQVLFWSVMEPIIIKGTASGKIQSKEPNVSAQPQTINKEASQWERTTTYTLPARVELAATF